ncbi:MAG: CAP domain-containing protein, partial [Persicimonas sp.]
VEPDGTSGEDAGDAGGSGCDDGLTECGGECVDTESSSDHCGGCDNPCPDDSCSEGVCSSISMQVLEATNEARTTDSDCGSEGEFSAADALEFDPDLTEAAQVHADDMAENDFIGHTGSDDSTFSERVDRTDYTGFPVGENVAAGYPTPEDVVDGWMDSDGHCRNIMNPDADEMGAAMVENSDGQYTYYWVQVFGSR